MEDPAFHPISFISRFLSSVRPSPLRSPSPPSVTCPQVVQPHDGPQDVKPRTCNQAGVLSRLQQRTPIAFPLYNTMLAFPLHEECVPIHLPTQSSHIPPTSPSSLPYSFSLTNQPSISAPDLQPKPTSNHPTPEHHLLHPSFPPPLLPGLISTFQEPNMSTNDIWTCCRCRSPNTIALCPELCPLCSHKKCSGCRIGRPTSLSAVCVGWKGNNIFGCGQVVDESYDFVDDETVVLEDNWEVEIGCG